MTKDALYRFMLENADTRGEWVHLDNSWQEVLKRADYPEIVRDVLGEAFAAVALLSATIKHQGSLILQIRSNGPVHLLVVQASPEGHLRGLARWSREPTETGLNNIFGTGHIAITMEATTDNERYQGIIALEGEKLSNALEEYFKRSEQLPTRLWLTSDADSCAGMLLQRLPAQQHNEEDWTRVNMLLDTLTPEELLNTEPAELIYRLYHEESPRLFDPVMLRFHCSCNLGKIENTIKSLGQEEADSIIAEQGAIEVNCEFCNSQYRLDSVDVARLFAGIELSPASPALH
ncbi:MAG: 33 kDa chaperonin (Heat shock protein 33) (HSP33) [uncultured Thiotrichaceae bacterium]|uniref:33 kDa chaperonin (Heat shock protein 33) (HSP33) n=1 Tax=uncultured Thiotrichaceae bacterium TaxID=298394 RepID=A0A6S6SGP4_9GAMM|nr:MAG: 33 kDa chaperonin (Heat shock protein 33) (HSP33) [uncultured Thiotrichaceae bacterium]